MEEKLGGTAVVQNDASEFLLEYYVMEDREKKYGIKIEKKEKKPNGLVLCEDYTSEYIIKSKSRANDILEILMRNKVTPITAESVLNDLKYL